MAEPLFEPMLIPPDLNGVRTCGTCLKPLKLAIDFYRDGKDKDGNPKHRRDCKDCYRKTRLNERKIKQPVVITKKPQGRRRSK